MREKRAFLLPTLCCLLVLSGCVTASSRSSLYDPAKTVLPQAASQAAPDWRSPLKASEVKSAYLLGEDLLLHTLIVAGTMQTWGVYDHELILLNKVTGAVKWRKSTAALQMSFKDIVGTNHHVLISGFKLNGEGHTIMALDKRTGAEVWKVDTPRGYKSLFIEEQQLAVVTESTEERFTIKAVDMTNGRQVWKQTLDKGLLRQDNPSHSLLSMADELIVTGTRSAVIRAQDGTVVNTGSLNGMHPLVSIKPIGQDYLYFGGGRISRISGKDRSVVWTRQSPTAPIISYQPHKQGLFLLHNDGEAGSRVSLIDPMQGKELWSFAERKIWSSLWIQDGTIYYTSQKALVTADAGSGKRLASSALPAFMHWEVGLPDKLEMVDGKVIVARESGVAAMNARTLKLEYAHAVKGHEVYSFQYSSGRYAVRMQGRSGGSNIQNYVGLTGAMRDQIVSQQTGQPASMTNHVGYGRGFESAAQAANLASSVVAAGIAFREYAVSANLNINAMLIPAAWRLQDSCIQAGYYLRPFKNKGWGVAVVRLRDGARADYYASPPNEPLMINSPNIPMVFIDQDGDQLVFNGLGFAPQPAETYSKVGFGKNVYGSWPGIPPTWEIPYMSMFGLPLDKLKFTPYRPGALPPAPPVLAPNEVELRQAILQRNDDRVEQLIQMGADVNAVDQLGFNALFYAAVADFKKAVKLLVKNGVDARKRDYSGLLAYHYTFLNHGDNRSTNIIRSANLKQGGSKE